MLPRGAVLHNAPPAATLEALAGVAIGPEDLRTIVAGCGFAAGAVSAARAFDRAWVAVDAGSVTSWLRQTNGAWQMVPPCAERSRCAMPISRLVSREQSGCAHRPSGGLGRSRR